MIVKTSFAYKIVTEDTIAIVVRKDCEKYLDIILIICKIDLLIICKIDLLRALG